MFTDAEIDALARDILTRVLKDFGDQLPPNVFQVIQAENGEQVAIYADTSLSGDGSFACQYMPIDPAKKILKHCERVYDNFIANNEVHPSFEKIRDTAIEAMADCAVLHLIASFPQRLRDLLEDVVEDSYVIGDGVMAASLAKYLTKYETRQFRADARPEIQRAVRRAADKRKALLREHLKAMPEVIAERGRGAPAKSPARRKRERELYIKKLEDAYRRVRSKAGKKPTKISVARELGEGGLNPKTGVDSSSQAFRNKLTRLEIDYDAMSQKIENELNNNY